MVTSFLTVLGLIDPFGGRGLQNVSWEQCWIALLSANSITQFSLLTFITVPRPYVKMSSVAFRLPAPAACTGCWLIYNDALSNHPSPCFLKVLKWGPDFSMVMFCWRVSFRFWFFVSVRCFRKFWYCIKRFILAASWIWGFSIILPLKGEESIRKRAEIVKKRDQG